VARQQVSDVLGAADAARAAGGLETAARLYSDAAAERRSAGDLEGWAQALLGAASVHVFGAEPGRLPAQLYEVLERTTDEALRARLAAALARCWVYAGEQERGLPFAEQALRHAEHSGSPELIADSLDAALAAHWGPDELETRRALAARLDAVAAHLLDPDARLKAHLWGLQVACDLLDLHTVHRHLRALELLGEDSPKARFFAVTRRLMLDLMQGRTHTTAFLLADATDAGQAAGLPDAWMVVASQRAYSALQSGDLATCAEVAEKAESFALAEGSAAVCAEAAFMWVGAGRLERAAALVSTFHGPTLDRLRRDVNWLLTLQCVLEAALTVGDREVIQNASRLLGPFAGRAVFNAGAMMFHGFTDDTLCRAAAMLGDTESAGRLRSQALAAYEGLGARWWLDRLESGLQPAIMPTSTTAHLRALGGGLWVVGSGTSPVPVKGLRGFVYLVELLRCPHQPVAALDLSGGGTSVLAESGLGEVIDRQALSAYRQRLADVQEELREAQEWADAGRVVVLTSERDALIDEIGAATGLRGRLRVSGSSGERARVAVQKAITAAIERIATVDEPMARHLRAYVHTGLLCRYEPDPATAFTWVLAADS
jgi:hypothetical protein